MLRLCVLRNAYSRTVTRQFPCMQALMRNASRSFLIVRESSDFAPRTLLTESYVHGIPQLVYSYGRNFVM